MCKQARASILKLGLGEVDPLNGLLSTEHETMYAELSRFEQIRVTEDR